MIPFKVGMNGSHAIASNWTLDLSSRFSLKHGACPAKNINYHPPRYGFSSAGCFGRASLDLLVVVFVRDVSNASWSGSSSLTQGYAYREANWWNSTTCYNSGNASCANTTINSSGSRAFGTNAPGFGAFTWNGLTQFTMWSNGTMMSKNDRYVLAFIVFVRSDTGTDAVSLLTHWSASASTSVDMTNSPRGTTLNWVSIR